jgi:ribosome-binding factor A
MPPPKVIHIKFGNMKIKEFHKTINKIYNSVMEISKDYKLVNVYIDRIEEFNHSNTQDKLKFAKNIMRFLYIKQLKNLSTKEDILCLF